MIWGKQFYCYDVKRWLDGDPTQPPPPPERRHGRNAGWLNVDARDILSMPDPWEYPWFAAWDLAFHTVALAHLDPAFAKYQLLVMCREWFQHPNGALPAYEWAFGDANPPVHAWAALHVWDIDGRRDHDFLARLLPKLLMNFTWWVNRMDPEGDHLFAGGFLGLDNISAIDRSNLPPGGRLEQADGTSWMAFYALTPARDGQDPRRPRTTRGPTSRSSSSSTSCSSSTPCTRRASGTTRTASSTTSSTHLTADRSPIKVRSHGRGAAAAGHGRAGARRCWRPLGTLRKRFAGFLGTSSTPRRRATGPGGLSVPGTRRRRHRRHPARGRPPRPGPGVRRGRVPLARTGSGRCRSTTRTTRSVGRPGGIAGLRRLRARRVALPACSAATPTGGGRCGCRSTTCCCATCSATPVSLGATSRSSTPPAAASTVALAACAEDLRRRLISLFLRGPDGRRPCHGWVDKLQNDPRWRDNITFNEYFHGDNGAGLGATHQTGWTGLVADLICRPDPFGRGDFERLTLSGETTDR